MKKILLALILGMAGLQAMAQQDPLYTQYMFNGLVLNPAYAGSKGYISSTLVVRKQWTGFEGAPCTQSFSVNGPSRNRRHGFGLTAVNDKNGATNTMAFSADYAFRIPTGKHSALALGLEGGIANWRADLLDLRSQTTNDPVIAANNANLWEPDAAAGLYFSSDRVFAGASVRHLVPGTLYERHYLMTAGVVVGLSRQIKFKPSILVKYHPAAPLQFDLNANFLFAEKIWAGVSWRSDDALSLLLQWQLSKAFRIGYAYDYGISPLRTYHTGSHELMLGFDLHFKSHHTVSPRYF